VKKTREALISYLYQFDLLSSKEIEIDDEKIKKIFLDIIDKIEIIDEVIVNNLTSYTIDRLSYIDRAIVRLATYELKYSDLKAAIIINEAIKLTKKYTNLDDMLQHKFNNKLIDNINKYLR